MCGPSIYRSELTELNGMTATREERLAGAEESRRLHRSLYDAVVNAWSETERRKARKAWNDHIEGHKATAERIRAGREK